MESFHLSRCTRLAYGVGHVFNDLCASIWFTYLLVFLQRVAGFSHYQAGLLLFWGQLIDALCTPVIGYVSDWHSAVKHCCGRQKVWHALGALQFTFQLLLLFRAFLKLQQCLLSFLLFYTRLSK